MFYTLFTFCRHFFSSVFCHYSQVVHSELEATKQIYDIETSFGSIKAKYLTLKTGSNGNKPKCSPIELVSMSTKQWGIQCDKIFDLRTGSGGDRPKC